MKEKMFTLSHKIRLTPTLTQREALARACGCSRFAWNWALGQYTEMKKQGVARVSMNDLKKQFNQIKGTEFPWIYGSPKDCNQQPFANLKKALNTFYKCKKAGGRKVGFPKFKKKGQHDSFYLSNDKFLLRDSKVRLPLIGLVKMTESLRFPGKVMSGTVSRTSKDLFISIQVQLPEDYKRPSVESENVLGVDLGLKTFAVTSESQEFTAPKPLKKYLRKLQRLSRGQSRKKLGSSNRRKSNEKLGRLHQKITNIRKDFIHKLTSQLLRENQTVVIEDLSVSGMKQLWGRAISDVGFAEFRRQAEYKAPLYRRQGIIADRYFPSTKMCCECGNIKKTMGLTEREYICENLGCGVITDRDLNASYNLRDYGMFILNKLGTASAEVTSVEILALATPSGLTKLGSLKQKSPGGHICSPRK